MDDLLDVWRAGAPAIDMLSPDAYSAKDFAAWCGRYSRSGNPLFIAESSGGPAGAPRLLYAIGHGAIGLSVYGVEFNLMRKDPTNELGRVYQRPFATHASDRGAPGQRHDGERAAL